MAATRSRSRSAEHDAGHPTSAVKLKRLQNYLSSSKLGLFEKDEELLDKCCSALDLWESRKELVCPHELSLCTMVELQKVLDANGVESFYAHKKFLEVGHRLENGEESLCIIGL